MQTCDVIDDASKRQVWQAFENRQPTRVPVDLYTNPRVILLNPQWNTEGWTFEAAATDPETHIRVLLQHELYRRQVINRYCDHPTELPEVWKVSLFLYNIYEAAILGCEVKYEDEQVPDTVPIEDRDALEALMDAGVPDYFETPFAKHWLQFEQEMVRIAEGMTFEGRPVQIVPMQMTGSDGAVTVCCNLRGTEFLLDLVAEPEFADRLMSFVTDCAIQRRQAYADRYGFDPQGKNTLADDSCAMLSPAMLEERVLPLHQRWYETSPCQGERLMHMCGDATRLFPILHERLNVMAFDTGFPVDFGKLREQLGLDVRLLGGPQVAMLLQGKPEQVHERTREILQSGIMNGGRFILREGNNLPPLVPEENLAAYYAAALAYGQYE